MDRLLSRLERRFGRFAIEHLTWVVVGGMAAVFTIAYVRPQFLELIYLNIPRVMHGEVWRLFTFIFVPETLRPMWVLFSLYWLWLMGTNLESEWGAFKFNAYYGIGVLGTIIGAVFVGGGAGNFFLNLTLTFAFATLFPDYQFLMFFLIPMRMKWLAWLTAAYIGYAFVEGDWPVRAAIVASLANYFLFFGGHLWGLVRGRSVQMKQAARRAAMDEPAPEEGALGRRACAICGAKEEDGADIRVCSCEKCGGKPRTLCLEHARNH
jgi:hypothetical protein